MLSRLLFPSKAKGRDPTRSVRRPKPGGREQGATMSVHPAKIAANMPKRVTTAPGNGILKSSKQKPAPPQAVALTHKRRTFGCSTGSARPCASPPRRWPAPGRASAVAMVGLFRASGPVRHAVGPLVHRRFAVRRGCRGAGPGAAGGRLAAAPASVPAGTLTGREGQIFCRRADGPSGQAAPRMV